MKVSTIKAIEAIIINQEYFVKNKQTGEFEWITKQVNPTVIVKDSNVFISAEDGKYLADYYGEFRGGYPWIEPELTEALSKLGLEHDWQDAGTLSIYEA